MKMNSWSSVIVEGMNYIIIKVWKNNDTSSVQITIRAFCFPTKQQRFLVVHTLSIAQKETLKIIHKWFAVPQVVRAVMLWFDNCAAYIANDTSAR